MDWQVFNVFMTFVRDDSKKFTLGGSYSDTAAWGITSVEGIGVIQAEVSTEKNAVGDGDTVTGVRLPARNIDITANVKNRSNNDSEKRNALSFFNPKYNFTLLITRGNSTKWIIALVEKVQCPETSGNQQLSLSLKCVDPYFYSKDNYGKNIASVKTTFGFPYISPISKGFNVGIYNFARQVEIENTGDAETYFTIRIEAFGEVINPKVVKDNAYIRLIDTLQNGDSIDIDLVGNTIKKNGSNCIGKVDRTSSFTGMVMDIGDNTISFAADNGDTNMKVTIYYNLRYLGA